MDGEFIILLLPACYGDAFSALLFLWCLCLCGFVSFCAGQWHWAIFERVVRHRRGEVNLLLLHNLFSVCLKESIILPIDLVHDEWALINLLGKLCEGGQGFGNNFTKTMESSCNINERAIC